MVSLKEKMTWTPKWTLDKFKDPDGTIAKALKAGANIEDFKDAHYEHSIIDHNCLLNTGIDEMWDIILGDSANVYSNDLCKIGVGDDGTTAAAASQTDLQGASTTYVTQDDTYPTSTTQKATWRATFDGDAGNHAWREFTIKQDTSSICLNRVVAEKGTKVVGETWTVSLEVTLS